MISKEINNNRYPLLGVLLFLILVSAFSANAGINFNYTNATSLNYTITDAVLNSNNFIRLSGGTIEMPSITLKFGINKTLVNGNKSLVLNTSSFGPKTTSLPNQKVYTVSGSTAAVTYTIDASNTFAGKKVNVSTFKKVGGNIPFFSDFSSTLLNFNDLKNTWSDDTKVLNEFTNTTKDENKINEFNVTLDSNGDNGPITQNLSAGNYLILVTKAGTDPKEIITWNIVKVLPFGSTINVGDGSGNALKGLDLVVNITLPASAPAESYNYMTSIINRSDYADNLGNINILWNAGTLAAATKVNGTEISDASALTDIIPRSNTARTTTSSLSTDLILATGSLPAGDYLVNTMVFNSTNLSVAFSQSLLTLATKIATPITEINGSGYMTDNVTVLTPKANITVILPNNTKATLADGVTAITTITAYSTPEFNATIETAASGANLKFLGENITLQPAGAKFNPYILLKFNYSDADIPSDVTSVKAYWYNITTDIWEALETNSIGTNPDGSKFIEAKVTHFSTFALLGTGTSAAAPSGGGGGTGGGSSGVVTAEPFDNIAKVERHDASLIANMPVTYTFTAPELGIYNVVLTGKENENDIALRVELLKGTSKLVTVSPPGIVYKNINIWAGTKRMKEVLIRFKIDNNWISSNNVASGDVKLLKWDGSKWVQLETKEISLDASYRYYEAKTDTFSHFAIIGLREGITLGKETPQVTAQVVETPEVSKEINEKAKPVNLITVIVMIIFIAIVAGIYLKRK